MSYKAIYAGLSAPTFGDGALSGSFCVVDLSANSIIDQFQALGIFGVDFTVFTPTELVTVFQSQFLAYASTKGYGLTASDIDWQGLTQFTASQAAAAIAGTQPRVYSTPTFSQITSARQISATRNAEVSYDIDATVSLTLLAGQSVTATLKYADNSGMSTNVVTASSQIIQSSGILGLTNTQTLKLSAGIPAGKYTQVTFAVTGGATAPTAVRATQEVLV